MNQLRSVEKTPELLNEHYRESKHVSPHRPVGKLASSHKAPGGGARVLRTVLACTLLLSVYGCGQKGDLYLPDRKPQQAEQ